MFKQTIQYTSPLDALIAVTKRLNSFENQHRMDSEEFFDKYTRGQMPDDSVGRMITVTICIFIRN